MVQLQSLGGWLVANPHPEAGDKCGYDMDSAGTQEKIRHQRQWKNLPTTTGRHAPMSSLWLGTPLIVDKLFVIS